MFDMSIFLENPEIFYSFAKELYPSSDVVDDKSGITGAAGGGKTAGKVHHWIRRLEKEGRLLRNYTQNIDTLEMIAGIEKVLHAHGEGRTLKRVRYSAMKLKWWASPRLLRFLLLRHLQSPVSRALHQGGVSWTFPTRS